MTIRLDPQGMAHQPAPKHRPCRLDEAFARIDARIRPLNATITLPCKEALGHVLAQDLTAAIALPPFDSAAMDGFALNESELSADGRGRLRLGQAIPAGRQDVRALAPGEAARIMTGGLIPPGADRVIRQEQSLIEGREVSLWREAGDRPHIRRSGEDLARGAVAVRAGTRLTPGHLALLAGLGQSHVAVIRRPRVALLSTGDELVPPGQPLLPGQIHDSNRPLLRAMLAEAGAEVTDLGRVADAPDMIQHHLATAAASHDLLITSGGASVGFADHLGRIIDARGGLDFHRVDMRPGKPVGFGHLDGCPILLLPGNPLAALAGFVLFGRQIVHLLGGKATPAPRLSLPITRGYEKPVDRSLVLAARLQNRDGITHAVPLEGQGSASLPVLAAAEVLILLGPGPSRIEAGEMVEVLPLHPPG